VLKRTNIFVFFTIPVLIAILFNESVFSQDTTHKSTSQVTVKKDSIGDAQNSAIKSKVIYSARDSIRFDVANQKVFLYGDSKVTYEDMDIKAGYIEFDMEHNIVFAHGARDSLGKPVIDSAGMAVGDPVFKQGAQGFDSKQITYNFQTKKGKIRDIRTEEGEGVIHAKDAKKDTGDVYYVKNGKYSTCNLENPHFYLKSTKIKVIPDNKIIVGPSYLVVGDVPTPLMLPFGVFPNKKGRKSGVIIPTYGQSNLGYFLTNGGYYFGLSDYFDLSLRGDIYSQGSFGAKANTNYVKRYKYNGFLGLNFSRIQIGEKEFHDQQITNTFLLNWQHAQDMKANPTFRFSANVNAGSSSYNKYNSYNPNVYLSNTMQSNISMTKSWRNSNLSLGASHSQNTITHALDVTLPEATFSINKWYPLRRKVAIGSQKWYEKLGFSVTVNAKNKISTIDSLLFNKKNSLELKPDAYKLLQNGLNARIPISTSMNVGPFIITPSFTINGVGYFQTIKEHYNADSNKVFTDTLRGGFKTAYDYNAAIGVSTKLYGMFMFKHGRVKAIRHVLTPGVSFSYRPDFSQRNFGFYETIQTTSITPTSPEGTPRTYSYFQNGIYGAPPSGKSGMIGFSLSNNLEMKLRPSKKDTSTKEKKVMLIDNFSISTSYNLAVDSFNWSPISLSGRTRLFQKVDLTLNGIIDPYKLNYGTGKDTKKLLFDETHQIGRLTTASLSISTSLRSLTGKTPPPKPATSGIIRQPANSDELNYILQHPDYYVDFHVPWNLAVNYNLMYISVYRNFALHDSLTQSLMFSGDLNVTKKWKVGFRSGFDFIKKDFTFTSFDIYRDLHCWEMRLNWVPFGPRKYYMVTIAVKASALQDMKLMRKREWYDYN